jgi:hypothetical protein
MIPKGISQTSFPNPKYILSERKKQSQGTISVVYSRTMNLLFLLKFHNTIEKYVVPPLLTAEWLRLVILFWKYLVDISW